MGSPAAPDNLPSGEPEGGGPPAYAIDPAHSSVIFAVPHMDFAAVHGRFNAIAGRVVFDPERPGESRVTARLQTASIDTGHTERDEALRSDLFLNAQAHPEIVFRSENIEVTGERRGKVTGTLALAGTQRDVTLDVVFNRKGEHPLAPELEVVGFTARTQLSRSEFGVAFGTPEIGDTVEVQINVEALRRQRQN